MDYYDIHTHDVPPPTEEDEQRRPYILDVYPLGFEDAKDSLSECFFSCGIHPWYSEDAEPQLKFLKEIVNDSRIIAIGEAGYDKLKGPDLKTQQYIFESQIELSEKLQKPLIIHCIKCWEELIQSYKKYAPKQTWIIHGYRGKPELTRQLLNFGFYFSIGDKFNKESISEIPLDHIFCETDDDDITIESVYEELAETLGMPIEDLCGQIENNVKKVFPQLISEKAI
ncbi:MAG: TatD family hydrolase [Dysgonomonas sp.]